MAKDIEIRIPDIGGAANVDVIELLVKEGDTISKETPLITLETDKATMEIPSPIAGVITKLSVKVGDKVSEGNVIMLASANDAEAPKETKEEIQPVKDEEPVIKEEPVIDEAKAVTKPIIDDAPVISQGSEAVFAGPAVRRLAREFGIDLAQVKGSGRKERISKEDLQVFVKQRLSQPGGTSTGLNLPTAPVIDFSVFGEIDTKPLNKIKKLTGINVHRSWVTIPHVTQFDEADITDLEQFRKSESESATKAGYKLTLLAFVCKTVVNALKEFPQFNASLDPSGEQLIYKKYYNLGIAVETPNGLVVPVIKNVNQLSVSEIAIEMARLSTKAREKGLMPADMSGGCFTISSLGGIGGTAFTPIVNSPEVAILGLSRSSMKPVYQRNQFVPRLILPLSLSYDHRVIDGAEAARFTRYIAEALSDIRKILL